MTFVNLRAPLAVGLGAIPGALSRYYLGGWLTQLVGLEDFPIGTMGVNLLGCFLLGGFVAWISRHKTIPSEIPLLVATGFLGSLTTFSSYELEIAALVEDEGWQQDWLYGLGSPLLGLACLYGGLALGGVRGKGVGK
jgi:CrcB protein